MAIENVELMQECCAQQLHMRTAIIKEDKETVEEGKQKKS